MPNEYDLAESVRNACLEAALEAYESAGISGLCHEGRWEIAVQTIRCLDLKALIKTEAVDEDAPIEQKRQNT